MKIIFRCIRRHFVMGYIWCNTLVLWLLIINTQCSKSSFALSAGQYRKTNAATYRNNVILYRNS